MKAPQGEQINENDGPTACGAEQGERLVGVMTEAREPQPQQMYRK
jgi:hypothetical protein